MEENKSECGEGECGAESGERRARVESESGKRSTPHSALRSPLFS